MAPPLCVYSPALHFLLPRSLPVYPTQIPVYLKPTWMCDLTTGCVYHSVLYIFTSLISDLRS